MSSPAPNRQHKLRQGGRSAKPSAAQSHLRESSRSGESVRSRETIRSGGVSKHLNNNLHRPWDTQIPPCPQGELPIHVDTNHYRSLDAQVQLNLQRTDLMHIDADLRRPMNARAPPHPQEGAPRYSDPIPQHPSNFQGQSAQQEHFNEGRHRGQPISPQLVAAAADSRPLLRELNAPIRSVYENQRRERSPPPPAPRSFSEPQLAKDSDRTRSQRHTDNVTGQRGWRKRDSSVRSSSRPRLPRPQPGSGSEIFSRLEAPKSPHETTTCPGTRFDSTEQVQLIPIEGIRPARERDSNRYLYPGPDFPPDPRYDNPIPAGLSLRVFAGDQNQASSSKSSVSDAHASDLRDGSSSRESSQSSPSREDRIRSSSQRRSGKSNHPWQHSLLGDWKNSESKGKNQDGCLLGKILKQAGYVDATTTKGLVHKPKSENNKNNSKSRSDCKSNHRRVHRKEHNNRSSFEEPDDESVEGLPPPTPPHQFDTRPPRHTR